MTAPLAILHVCGEGHPSGQSRVILELARGQAAAGHRVAVGCPPGSVLEASVRDLGVTAAPIPFDATAATGAAIADLARLGGFDLVNAHSSLDRKATLLARGRGRLAAALVFTRHVRTLTFPPKLWWQTRHVDRVIAVSRDVAGRLVARGAARRKVVVVPNGLPAAFLDARPDAAAIAGARARLEGVPGAPIVGVVSRRKAQEVLLRAARHIARPLNLAFIGIAAEPELERLAARLPRHAVRFVPFVADPRAYYACLAVSALPSRQEGLSIAQLESMALGIPFVGSRFAGIPDLTTDGVDGLLVRHGDTRAWARAIERLLDDPFLARRLATTAKQKVLESFTFDRTLASTEAVYRDAIAARGRA
ncbi:MAG: glycosyltransferase family 4 protein [Candidatus Eisenbacteria bacterium]|nr:glycosyltransferase family 4 protein [Candidatus Eisenbacteria bacterium]